ncbi:MAG: endolytic transglycosylase MltG, partial [Thermodesulfobacteriota bacterium]
YTPQEKVIVEIPRGWGLQEISRVLEHSGVVKSDKAFIIYTTIKGVQNKLQAGEYEFSPADNINSVIDKLVRGDVIVRKISIPEGLNIDEIANLLEKKGVLTKEEFIEKARNSNFAKQLLGENIVNFEGYLFPETYFYKKGATAEEIIGKMVGRFKKVWNSLKVKNSDIDLSDHEIVTLASIIEKETGDPTERNLISEVFHNRLKIGMRLESDPTVIYSLGSEFNGNLTKNKLKTESEYNTYINEGLPPGPIANPGKESLEAALNPSEFNYLYFVSRGNGTHVFSKNYKDHLRAVKKYQNSSRTNGKMH